MYNSSSDLLPVVLEETGGLGVDIIIDSGGKPADQTTLKFQSHKPSTSRLNISLCACL